MEIITTLTAAQIAILTLAVVGATELVNRLFAKDYNVAAKIVIAAVFGAAIAAYWRADPVGGAALGLSGSGVLKALGAIGNKNVAQPRGILPPAVAPDDGGGVDESEDEVEV